MVYASLRYCAADFVPGLLTNVPGVDCRCTVSTGLGDVCVLCIDCMMFAG
jgi:hypothetical protein